MKRKLTAIAVLILLIIPTTALSFSLKRKMQYVSMDSLSCANIQSNIILKLKNDSIVLEINKESLSFTPKYTADSITFVDIYPSLISSKNENVNILLTIGKLLLVEKDSICVSAKYQEFDAKKGWNLGRIKTIDSIYVRKNDIQGALLPEITVNDFRLRQQAYRQWRLTGGYQFNTYEKKQNNHIIELGITKVNDGGGMEPAGLTYYFANEFLFNSKNFSIGPKLGGSIYIWGVVLGSEIVYYTNFRDNTLHWVPYWGFGIGAGKLFMAGHIPFYNKKYPVNEFSVGLTIPICNLSKKKIISNLE